MNLFAERLRKERLDQKMSLNDLQNITGINKGIISNYENDKSKIGQDNLIAFAKALNVTSDYLLGLSDKKRIDD